MKTFLDREVPRAYHGLSVRNNSIVALTGYNLSDCF